MLQVVDVVGVQVVALVQHLIDRSRTRMFFGSGAQAPVVGVQQTQLTVPAEHRPDRLIAAGAVIWFRCVQQTKNVAAAQEDLIVVGGRQSFRLVVTDRGRWIVIAGRLR